MAKSASGIASFFNARPAKQSANEPKPSANKSQQKSSPVEKRKQAISKESDTASDHTTTAKRSKPISSAPTVSSVPSSVEEENISDDDEMAIATIRRRKRVMRGMICVVCKFIVLCSHLFINAKHETCQ